MPRQRLRVKQDTEKAAAKKKTRGRAMRTEEEKGDADRF
jgi:hypothetical protein